jgi:hypothetical protein
MAPRPSHAWGDAPLRIAVSLDGVGSFHAGMAEQSGKENGQQLQRRQRAGERPGGATSTHLSARSDGYR